MPEIMDDIQVPASERYEAVEGADGELGFYVGWTAGSPRSQGIGGSATGAVADDLAAGDELAQEP